MERTFYYRHEGGGYSTRTVVVEDGTEVPPPAGAVEISQSEYRDGVAAVESAHAEYVAGLEEADEVRARADYEALIAAGIPEETARRMSGYRPDTGGDES